MSDDPASRPGWLLDEHAGAGRENLDAAHVAQYDDKEQWDAEAEVRLLHDLGLDERSTVLDLGAGTGRFTRAVAPHCGRVIAVDPSPVMHERLAATAGLHNVERVEAGLVSYEHAGPPVDIAYSRYALHHLPDFWKVHALARLARAMRPGAILRLWDIVFGFAPHEIDERIGAWRASLPERAGPGDWVRADIEEHVRDEHSTFTWLLEPMIERCGLRIERAEYSDDHIFAKYITRKPGPTV